MKLTRWPTLFATLAMASAGNPALASEQTSGTVVMVAIDSNGGPYTFYVVGGTRTTKPTCAAGDDVWAISGPATDNAKAMYATILTAYSLGRPVKVVGKGTCDPAAPTREIVAYINAL